MTSSPPPSPEVAHFVHKRTGRWVAVSEDHPSFAELGVAGTRWERVDPEPKPTPEGEPEQKAEPVRHAGKHEPPDK